MQIVGTVGAANAESRDERCACATQACDGAT